ncbi:hypothetical protein N9489_00840 [Methylophilaceae bacterium]|nr:hypothetical protein [Methylophilaceae bacterium]
MNNFKVWLKTSTKLSDKSISNYVYAMNVNNSDLAERNMVLLSLIEIKELDELKDLMKQYFSIKEIKQKDKKGKGMYSAAFKKYISFYRSKTRLQNMKNLKTEKEGIIILRDLVEGFMVPTKEQKMFLYDLCNIDYKKYFNSIDGIIIHTNDFDSVKIKKDFLFVEVKTTNSKTVKKLPYNVFFGFTKNEEDLFKKIENYRLCIVHVGMKEYKLLTFNEYESLIQTKRIQYQVNFKSK